MSADTQGRQSTRPYTVDCNCRKVIRTLDLNAPPPEEMLPEDTAVPVHPQQGPQAVANGGFLFSPIDVDVEAIDDEILMLSSSTGFPQSRRKHPMVIVDEELEVRAGRTGIFIENLMPTVSPNSLNMYERLPANMMIIDCEIYPSYRDDHNLKRKRAKSPCRPEPVRVVEPLKEPTFSCPVCLNDLVDACSTKCGHVFCQGCIKNSIKAMKKCPTCRKPLTMRGFHRVYLPAANRGD